MTARRLGIGLVVLAASVALAWALIVGLARVLGTPDAPETEPTPAAPTPAETAPAVARISVKLFFASESGQRLVAVDREVPLAEDVVAQARAIIETQLAEAAPAPLAETIPEGTTLRGLYLSDRNEMFVDLDGAVRGKHPGGSMNEILTVYTIVNAVTVNLPTVPQVQLLIDGHEVDTLAGHVDLRRPLRKNDELIQQ